MVPPSSPSPRLCSLAGGELRVEHRLRLSPYLLAQGITPAQCSTDVPQGNRIP